MDRWPEIPVRILLTWLLLVSALGSVGMRLYHLQMVQASILLERAQAQQSTQLSLFVPRRSITDRNGNALAIDQPVYTLYAHPDFFGVGIEAMATQLAPLVGQDHQSLVTQFQAHGTGIPVAHTIPLETAERIQRLGLDGLDLYPQQQRLYPTEELFAQIVGYVDLEGQGQAGLEASQEAQLQQVMEPIAISRMGDGSLMPDRMAEQFAPPDSWSLRLTLDSRLQRVAQIALQQQLDRYHARRGTVMAMDVRDGSLVALVTLPTYDPNQYYDAEVERFRNWAVSDLYEPGSTFKPLNVAIALEQGVIQPEDTVYDEGRIHMAGWPIENHDFRYVGGHGVLSITEVLEHSSNVGMVRIIQRLNSQDYYDWLQKLGLNQPLETDLPYETIGQLKTEEMMVNQPIEAATASFGQGLAVTPLKMLQLHAALANGGQLVTPHVLAGLVDSEGQMQWQPDRPQPQPLFSPDTTQAVLGMMESVVVNGTGKNGAIDGYRVAGKTGTAQKAEGGVYVAGAKITSFVGILSVDQPQYVVLAVVDEPLGEDAFGSTVAAPVVKQVMETLTRLSLEPIPRAGAQSVQ
jgi:cell division protein FtsI (penicillin-binding protein 3)